MYSIYRLLEIIQSQPLLSLIYIAQNDTFNCFTEWYFHAQKIKIDKILRAFDLKNFSIVNCLTHFMII